jgi:hypothetical protein
MPQASSLDEADHGRKVKSERVDAGRPIGDVNVHVCDRIGGHEHQPGGRQQP